MTSELAHNFGVLGNLGFVSLNHVTITTTKTEKMRSFLVLVFCLPFCVVFGSLVGGWKKVDTTDSDTRSYAIASIQELDLKDNSLCSSCLAELKNAEVQVQIVTHGFKALMSVPTYLIKSYYGCFMYHTTQNVCSRFISEILFTCIA